MNTQLLYFFLAGFRLLNKNIEIYAFSLLLLLLATYISWISNALGTFTLIIFLFTLIINTISISYGLSIPFLLTQKQQGKIIEFSLLKKIIPLNLKRLLDTRTLLLSIIITILITVAFAIILFIYNLDVKKLTHDINMLNKEWSPGYIVITSIISILQSFFVFQTIFFSVQNQRFYTALLNSVIHSVRNIKFIGIVALFYIVANISSLLINLLPMHPLVILSLGFAVNIYISIGVVASALLYYQKNGHTVVELVAKEYNYD